MKNEGKTFELKWKESMPDNYYYLRIIDNASSFGADSIATRFTPKNPYDCLLFTDGRLYPMELKSTVGNSLSIQLEKGEKGKQIKLHQIESLRMANKFDNIYAGFVFDFRTSGNTYWISIEDFDLCVEALGKKSINEKDIISYHGILIEKTKRVKYYNYNITKMISDILTQKDKA